MGGSGSRSTPWVNIAYQTDRKKRRCLVTGVQHDETRFKNIIFQDRLTSTYALI